MGINSKVISTIENITKSTTPGWQSNKTSNKKVSLKDRKSPLKNFLTVTETNLSNKKDLIESKIDKATFSDVNSGLKDKINLKDMKIESGVMDSMRGNLVASISNSLEAPGMPLNAKTSLRKAIDSVCSKNVNLGLNSSLRDILNMLSMRDLMSLIKCLSNPIKLAEVTMTMLASSLDDKTVTKGLNSAISSKSLSVGNIKDMIKSDTGKRLLNESKNTLLGNIDKNVETDNGNDSELLDMLPKDSDSMCMYTDDGLFNSTIKNVANNKPSQTLSNTGDGTIDANTSLLVKSKSFLRKLDHTTL